MKVKAEVRTLKGRRGCKQLRMQGMYPAVLYGRDNSATMIQLDHILMDGFIKEHAVKSQLFSIELDNKSHDVLVKEIKRDTASNRIQHLDFYQVSRNKELQVSVPIRFVHEEQAVGVKAGGVVDHVMTEVGIKVLPKHLPEFLVVDIGALDIGGVVHVSELDLPKGVSLQRPIEDDYDPIIVSIHAPKVVEEDPEEEVVVDDKEAIEEEPSEAPEED